MGVVYFDQRLGVIHPKSWLKSAFQVFPMFLQDFDAKMIKNDVKMSIYLAYFQMLVDTKMLVQ